jgi:hypothetical protein
VGSRRWTSERGDLRGFLVAVRDFDLIGITGLPAETDPILLIDANAVLPQPCTCEPFKTIPRRNGKLAEITNPVELSQLPAYDRPENSRTRGSRLPAVDAVEQVLRGTIGEGTYHGMYYNGWRS